MVDFSRLAANWFQWTNMAGMTHVSVSTDCDDYQILFTSADESFHLRQDGDWWAIGEVDDRGKQYNNTAKFSNST